jgi:anti-sigma factor RsiW
MTWLPFRRRRRAIVCQQAVELVTDYLEDALPRDQRARLEAHLGDCPHCTEYFEQFRVTIRLLGRIEPDTLAPDVKDDLIALYRRWSA